MCIFLYRPCLQPLRGVVGFDGLTLYDHGGVTAFDAARGRGDGAGDVAGGQEHRETNRQGGEQGQQDLFDVLFHCGSFFEGQQLSTITNNFFRSCSRDYCDSHCEHREQQCEHHEQHCEHHEQHCEHREQPN